MSRLNSNSFKRLLGAKSSFLNNPSFDQKILLIKDALIKKTGGLLNNKTFMITGKLEGISRAEAKSLIEENSGSIVSNVSKKLDYLILIIYLFFHRMVRGNQYLF